MASSRRGLFRLEALFQRFSNTELIHVASKDNDSGTNDGTPNRNESTREEKISSESPDRKTQSTTPIKHSRNVGIDNETSQDDQYNRVSHGCGFVGVTTRRGFTKDRSLLVRAVISLLALVTLVNFIMILVLQQRLTQQCSCSYGPEEGKECSLCSQWSVKTLVVQVFTSIGVDAE